MTDKHKPGEFIAIKTHGYKIHRVLELLDANKKYYKTNIDLDLNCMGFRKEIAINLVRDNPEYMESICQDIDLILVLDEECAFDVNLLNIGLEKLDKLHRNKRLHFWADSSFFDPDGQKKLDDEYQNDWELHKDRIYVIRLVDKLDPKWRVRMIQAGNEACYMEAKKILEEFLTTNQYL